MNSLAKSSGAGTGNVSSVSASGGLGAKPSLNTQVNQGADSGPAPSRGSGGDGSVGGAMAGAPTGGGAGGMGTDGKGNGKGELPGQRTGSRLSANVWQSGWRRRQSFCFDIRA